MTGRFGRSYCEHMLLLIAVLAIMSAAFLLFRFTRRHDTQVTVQIPASADPPPNARPLFAPTDEELRRDSEAENARFIAKREYYARASSRAKVDKALQSWRDESNAKTAAELLRVAADSGLDGDFSRASNEIVDQFHSHGIDGLAARDIAALLDSHSRLLPAGTNNSGELFWLRQEIARLNEENVSE